MADSHDQPLPVADGQRMIRRDFGRCDELPQFPPFQNEFVLDAVNTLELQRGVAVASHLSAHRCSASDVAGEITVGSLAAANELPDIWC